MIEIPLTKGYMALVDDIDADLADFKWQAESSRNDVYYAVRAVRHNKKRTKLKIHRIVLERMLGRQLGVGEICDHVHGNTLDNRRSELRLADKYQNAQNQRKTSEYKGASYDTHHKKYRAQIGVCGSRIHLGYFDTVEEAHAVYCEAAKKYHGEFANFGSFELDKVA